MKLGLSFCTISSFLVLAACAPQKPAADANASSGSTTPTSATTNVASTATTTAPSDAAKPDVAPPDPKITELAKAALACPYTDDGGFDSDCAALKTWSDNDDLFEEGKGNATLFGMLLSSDTKTRVLALTKTIDDDYLADKGRAQALFVAANKETNGENAKAIGELLGKLDATKLGIESNVRDATKAQLPQLREGIADGLYEAHQSPFTLEIEKTFLKDSNKSVVYAALDSLSSAARYSSDTAACPVLVDQLARTDESVGSAHELAVRSHCADIQGKVIASIAKRETNADEVAQNGFEYMDSLESICDNDKTAAADKKKAYAAAAPLAASTVKSSTTRNNAMDAMYACDKAAARPIIQKAAQEKDSFISDHAKRTLAKKK